jgi:hypothetical protein
MRFLLITATAFTLRYIRDQCKNPSSWQQKLNISGLQSNSHLLRYFIDKSGASKCRSREVKFNDHVTGLAANMLQKFMEDSSQTIPRGAHDHLCGYIEVQLPSTDV